MAAAELKEEDTGRALVADDMRDALIAQIPILALFGAIVVLAGAAITYAGWPFPPSVILANLGLYPQGLVFALVIDSAITLIRERPDSPTKLLAERYLGRSARRSLAKLTPLLVVLCLFLPLFAILKPLIPIFNPFSWDAAFIEWDRALLGADAWTYLQPILGYPYVTSAMAMLYHGWFLLVYPVALLLIVHPTARSINRQYLFAYLATWIGVGFILAIAFSSVGPCFLDPIMGDPRFLPQMAYLESAAETAPIPVLDVQGMLLKQYLEQGPGHGTGISAMPSMHVALCMISWLAMRHVSRRVSHWLLAFTAVIWIGSVHLAYHYAVDGLVAIIAALAIWKVSGVAIKQWDAFLARRDQAALRTNTVPAE